MRALISHLVAAVIALHAMLGCCWHHAHDADTYTAEQRHDAATAEHCDGDCHQHEHAFADQESSHHEEHDPQAPGSHCCGEKCVYVAANRVQLDSPLAGPVLDLPLLVTESATCLGCRAAEIATLNAAVDPPPLRLHLLQQLLLI